MDNYPDNIDNYYVRCGACDVSYFYRDPDHWTLSYNGILTSKDELTFCMIDNQCIYLRQATARNGVILPMLSLDITKERLKGLLLML